MTDPKIRYDIEANVSGDADVGKLATQIEQLAGTLDGNLKTSALSSAAALRQLGQKDAAIQAFTDLKRDAQDAAANLAGLQRGAQQLGAELASVANPTRAQTGQMQKLRDAVRDAKAEVISSNQALEQARATLDHYGISTANLSQSQRAVKDAILGARVEVAAMAPAWQAAANAGSAAATQQVQSSKQIGNSVEALSSQLERVKAELLALVGVGVGVEGVKDLAALADGYRNLEARIKLTTGEGRAFDTAFQGVFDVAKRTNSAVEETGMLFTKLDAAGKSLGQSQAEALKLTETINQTIQLSGGSAESAKASITQLIQGLQSGVLRGDEFNSVMEQSPRLAKALSDGLGVTTAELRKMAEEGRLTSETIIKALQGQSAVVADEFSKLPATVGRSMQNLNTEFMRYVGETDKAHGYTVKLAAGIDVLARNLTTVASAMLHAGQLLGAMKLISMAQDWLTASSAIKTAAASTEVATAAQVRNTAATVANTAAQRANAAAWAGVTTHLGGVAPRLGATGVEAAAATSKIGMMGTAMAALTRAAAPLLALDIALNFKSYGTAIGEWAARMMGAKDRAAELAAEEKRLSDAAEATAASHRKQAAAAKDAADRAFGLTKEGSTLVAKFDEMRAKGDTAADAIGKIGKDFDLSTAPGIRTAAAVLDKLTADGKLSATQFKDAWAEALKGQDLATFETLFMTSMAQVRAEADKAGADLQAAIARGVQGKELDAFADKAREAMSLATAEAKRFEQATGAELQEAIRRTGLDMAVISGGMGKAARSAINDTDIIIKGLDRLKAQGVDTGRALAVSLSKGIDTADGQKALEALRAQIEAVRKVLGDKVADGLLDQAKQKALELRDVMEQATPGINSTAEALRTLGVTSDTALSTVAAKSKEAFDVLMASGTASTRELQAAFQRYAADAIAASGAVGSEQQRTTEALLEQKAALLGLKVAFDDSGNMIVKSQTRSADAIGRTNDKLREQKSLIDRVGGGGGGGSGAGGGGGGQGGGASRAQTPEDSREQRLRGQNAVDNTLMFKLRDKLQAGTLTAADLADLKNVTAALDQNKIMHDAAQTAGMMSAGGMVDATTWEAINNLFKSRIQDFERQTAGGLKPAGAPAPDLTDTTSRQNSEAHTPPEPSAPRPPTPAPAPTPVPAPQPAPSGARFGASETQTTDSGGKGASSNSTVTHRFEIGGKTTSVDVNSQADSDALVSVMRQLESARRSANG